MAFGVTTKLFAAVLVTNIATAIAVGLGVRAAFDSGFERYAREREEQRLVRLADVFANAYMQNGASWDFLRNNDALWVQLNHAVRPVGAPGGNARPFKAADRAAPPPGPANMAQRGRLALPEERPPPGLVLDLAGQKIVGDAALSPSLQRHAIVAAGGTVGYLAAPLRENVFDIVDRRFQQGQWTASWAVALGAIALAAVVAWFLARGLLAPVKRIADATRRLADGDYETRATASSRDELGRLVDDFNRLGNVLQKNETLRRHFIADISHELRTPIAVLKGEIEALQDGVRPVDDAALRSLQGEVARLEKLVTDVHDLSLADVGGLSFRFEPVRLDALVREALQVAQPRLEARGLVARVDSEGTVVVRADPRRVAQLVDNLLENSLRYTDGPGHIHATLRADANQALLRWEDSKPGVPDDALPRLFDRLFRVEASRNRAAGGSGLGLAITRSIAEAHGGSISAHHASLGGLRVDVRLPLANEAAA